ncbi:peptidase M4 [Pontibacillus halophilus JSM 076056 = DSM 19796]|uniref:Peptidase M4 n=1 Tax=Pontibacillus halophilus JSM 076056 = DSM 19796 TaxID=1385510 RepID=A0A0A5GE55_9BACI|nr:PepSY domain-containing protein [Pontibacillus halophilus]KGX89415.1 peptidase M4 [Pontibacillus halophilus JSM 076056 = DSM 19796]
MKMKKTLAIAGAGAIAAYFVTKQLQNDQRLSPEKALKVAKESFKRQGPISGSWIYMKPEEWTSEEVPYTVYRGGISKSVDGETQQYEFHVDAETGTILDVAPVS